MQTASQVTITVLCDNWARGRLLGEHGLAIWVEVDGLSILLDTGSGRTLFSNARELGVDLGQAHCIVLSHGHHDHGGGLALCLSHLGPKDVYAPAAAFVTRYAPDEDRSIGMPHSREHYRQLGARWREAGGIGPSVRVVTAGPHPNPPTNGPYRFRRLNAAGEWEADSFLDEQLLTINTPHGILVITGCTHTGLEHCLERSAEVWQTRQLCGVMGGLHLEKVDAGLIAQLSQDLARRQPQLVAPGHCSGLTATCHLAHQLPHAFQATGTGTRWSYPEDLAWIPGS